MVNNSMADYYRIHVISLYIDPRVYLFSCKLLSNYGILNVYFLSFVFVVVFICAAWNYRNGASQLDPSQSSERKPCQSVTSHICFHKVSSCATVITLLWHTYFTAHHSPGLSLRMSISELPLHSVGIEHLSDCMSYGSWVEAVTHAVVFTTELCMKF